MRSFYRDGCVQLFLLDVVVAGEDSKLLACDPPQHEPEKLSYTELGLQFMDRFGVNENLWWRDLYDHRN